MLFTLTKEFRFEAAHRLPHHDGKCQRLHGHSWVGRVILTGRRLQEKGPKSGMLQDFGEISGAVKPLLEDFLDHHYLNETTGLENPTSESLSKWIFDWLKEDLPQLGGVEIQETCTSSCLYEPSITIYGLVDPRSDMIRYVGKALNPEERFKCHLRDWRRPEWEHLPVYRWIASLHSVGLFPKMVTLEVVGATRWEFAEVSWIKKLRSLSAEVLLNVQDGGGQTNGFKGKKHSQETKDRISRSLQGRPPHNLGKSMSDPQKKKISSSLEWTKRKKK